MEKNEEKAKKKRGIAKIRIVFSSMIVFILFLAEIYLMLNSSEYFEGLVAVTVLLIAVLYILVTSIIQANYEKEQQIFNEFDDIYEAEKASYVLMRKNFDEINVRLKAMEDNVKIPTEEIIAAQKAIAKVNISRNKENTDALMNSNDKLLEKFFNFEDLIIKNNEKLVEQQKLIIDQANKEMLMKQQESLARLKEMELSIKNQILQSMGMISSGNVKINMEHQPVEEDSFSMDELLKEESESSSADFMNEEPENSSMDEFFGEEETEISVEDESDVEAEEEVLTEGEIEEDELSAEEVSAEPELPEEEIAEESELPEEEPIAEPEPMEEKPPMPDLSDPNKVMSPDDIAALLANAGRETEQEASMEEPIAELEPMEEKPPMPDLSDPNKVMSPDDIAALLANM